MFDAFGRDGVDLSLRLTLLTVLLYAGSHWYMKYPLTVMCAAAIVNGRLLRKRWFWVTVSLVLVAGNARNWYTIDNHKYLMTYWTIAIAASLNVAGERDLLRRSAALLLGLTFLLAVIHKLVSDDYVNGAFFHYTLLTDGRFRVISAFLGIGEEAWRQNHRLVRELMDPLVAAPQSVRLQTNAAVRSVALGLSWWGLGIEAVVGAAYLVRNRWFKCSRDWLLWVFVVTTYAVAPVVGFGWLLLAMGVAACERSGLRIVHACVFLVLALYGIPWRRFAVALAG